MFLSAQMIKCFTITQSLLETQKNIMIIKQAYYTKYHTKEKNIPFVILYNKVKCLLIN